MAYLVMYSDFAAPSTQRVNTNQVFERGRDVALSMVQGKLVSQRSLTLQGYPGKEIVVETPVFFVRDRMYLVNGRLYQVMVQISKDKQKSLSRSSLGFLNSFRLL